MKFLHESLVLFNVEVANSKEAIKRSGELLTEVGAATEHYTEAMLASYEKNGAYFVLAPAIALPHARPEDGVKEAAVSCLQLATPLSFGHANNDPVSLVFGLAASTGDEHLEILQHLSHVLGNPKKVEALKNTRNYADFKEIIGGL